MGKLARLCLNCDSDEVRLDTKNMKWFCKRCKTYVVTYEVEERSELQ